MAPSFVLRTVTPAGALDLFLPDFQSLDMSPVFCQAGTVVFKYPESGTNFALLAEDLELAVLMDGVEIQQLRCVIESVEGEDAAESEDGSIWGFTCRTLLGLLDRAVVYPKNWPATKPPAHDFVGASPGKILIDLLVKAQSRGTLGTLDWDFTATHDSAGAAWTGAWGVGGISISFDAGMTYTDVLSSMVEGGLLEVKLSGRVIRAYKVDTLGVDRSIGSAPLRFTRGRDIRESPRKISSREIATSVLVGGAEGIFAERQGTPAALTQWGRRESYYSSNNITDNGMLQYIGSHFLAGKDRPLMEVTHGLLFELLENAKPITHFDVGDWSLSDVGQGWERYRIKQWVMAVANDGAVTGTVVLNDLLAERDKKLNDKLTKLANGSSSAGATEEKDNGKVPSRPAGVTLSTDYYLDHQVSRAILTIDWAPVTTNTDGSELLNLSGYSARWKYQEDATWRDIVTLDSDETSVMFGNLRTDATVQAQVRAHNSWNRFSGWTVTEQITTARDLLAPEKPSPPVVTPRVGTLRLTWTGLDYLGQQQVADYAGVEVHVGPNGTFIPDETTLLDFLTARSATSATLVGDLEYGSEYWVRLVAVDTEGNRSAPSDETATSHAILTQVVSVEIGTGQIGLNNTRFSDIGNLVDDGDFENAQVRTDRQLSVIGSHMFFDDTTSSNGLWSLSVTGQSPWFEEHMVLQSEMPVKPGERIFGAADYKASADSNVNSTVSLIVVWYDRDRNIIDEIGNPGDVNDWETLATNYNRVSPNNTWARRITVSSKVAPPNVASFDIKIMVMTHFSGTIWIDAIEVRRQVDSLMIGQAVIQQAHIGLLQVNDANIASASIGKLTAGTLTADMTLSARIKTADTGARFEANASGLGLWNSSEVKTFEANSVNGEVTMRGRLVSSYSGRRVEINPTNTGLPEIRFYPSSGSNYSFINAVDAPGATSAYFGMNSGQFDDGGVLCTYRVYLMDATFGASFQTIRASDQTRYGGSWQIHPNAIRGEVGFGSAIHGYVRAFESGGSVGAEMGYSGGTATNNTRLAFNPNSEISLEGSWPAAEDFAPNRASAVVALTIPFDSAVTGVTWGWGSSAYSGWWHPHCSIRDQNPNGYSIDPISGTGFTVNYTQASIGISALDIWAWRD